MPFTRFPSELGECQLEWSDVGVRTFRLPGDTSLEAAPVDLSDAPAWIRDLCSRIQRHLAGEPQDFADVPFDLAQLTSFQQAVLSTALKVKSGSTRTYGWLASEVNQPASASRAVGSALGSNPIPLLIPCHRFIAATGKMTGFSAPGGVRTKLRLLAIEGAELLLE